MDFTIVVSKLRQSSKSHRDNLQEITRFSIKLKLSSLTVLDEMECSIQ